MLVTHPARPDQKGVQDVRAEHEAAQPDRPHARPSRRPRLHRRRRGRRRRSLPRHCFIEGRSGSGKTTLLAQLFWSITAPATRRSGSIPTETAPPVQPPIAVVSTTGSPTMSATETARTRFGSTCSPRRTPNRASACSLNWSSSSRRCSTQIGKAWSASASNEPCRSSRRRRSSCSGPAQRSPTCLPSPSPRKRCESYAMPSDRARATSPSDSTPSSSSWATGSSLSWSPGSSPGCSLHPAADPQGRSEPMRDGGIPELLPRWLTPTERQEITRRLEADLGRQTKRQWQSLTRATRRIVDPDERRAELLIAEAECEQAAWERRARLAHELRKQRADFALVLAAAAHDAR